MIGYLNLGSLVLGLIAWILPVINLSRINNPYHKNWVSFSIFSLSACGISLLFQMYYSYHLVKIEDWSALMDTTGVVVFAALLLLSVTILLNVMTLIVYRGRR